MERSEKNISESSWILQPYLELCWSLWEYTGQCLCDTVRIILNTPTLSGALLKSLRVYWAVSLWHSQNHPEYSNLIWSSVEVSESILGSVSVAQSESSWILQPYLELCWSLWEYTGQCLFDTVRIILNTPTLSGALLKSLRVYWAVSLWHSQNHPEYSNLIWSSVEVSESILGSVSVAQSESSWILQPYLELCWSLWEYTGQCLCGTVRIILNTPTLSGALLKSLRVYWAVSLWHSQNHPEYSNLIWSSVEVSESIMGSVSVAQSESSWILQPYLELCWSLWEYTGQCLCGTVRIILNTPTLSGALLKSLRVYWAVSLWHSQNHPEYSNLIWSSVEVSESILGSVSLTQSESSWILQPYLELCWSLWEYTGQCLCDTVRIILNTPTLSGALLKSLRVYWAVSLWHSQNHPEYSNLIWSSVEVSESILGSVSVAQSESSWILQPYLELCWSLWEYTGQCLCGTVRIILNTPTLSGALLKSLRVYWAVSLWHSQNHPEYSNLIWSSVEVSESILGSVSVTQSESSWILQPYLELCWSLWEYTGQCLFDTVRIILNTPTLSGALLKSLRVYWAVSLWHSQNHPEYSNLIWSSVEVSESILGSVSVAQSESSWILQPYLELCWSLWEYTGQCLCGTVRIILNTPTLSGALLKSLRVYWAVSLWHSQNHPEYSNLIWSSVEVSESILGSVSVAQSESSWILQPYLELCWSLWEYTGQCLCGTVRIILNTPTLSGALLKSLRVYWAVSLWHSQNHPEYSNLIWSSVEVSESILGSVSVTQSESSWILQPYLELCWSLWEYTGQCLFDTVRIILNTPTLSGALLKSLRVYWAVSLWHSQNHPEYSNLIWSSVEVSESILGSVSVAQSESSWILQPYLELCWSLWEYTGQCLCGTVRIILNTPTLSGALLKSLRVYWAVSLWHSQNHPEYSNLIWSSVEVSESILGSVSVAQSESSWILQPYLELCWSLWEYTGQCLCGTVRIILNTPTLSGALLKSLRVYWAVSLWHSQNHPEYSNLIWSSVEVSESILGSVSVTQSESRVCILNRWTGDAIKTPFEFFIASCYYYVLRWNIGRWWRTSSQISAELKYSCGLNVRWSWRWSDIFFD